MLKQKGMTMTELHEITGISQNALSPIANGKSNGIQFNTLDKILEATNSKIEELIERGEELYSLFIRSEDNNSKKPNFLGWGFKG
ncbi:helix-turn-helix domain-containing protein [Priestia endophytica]|uniref:helix-turn-helix domain-containing protein n=1 Tax=Priestia endophytica TaxID=135735 RepID=UPI0035D50B91